MVDKQYLGKLPKPAAIALISTLSVAAIVFSVVLAPKICKKMVDNYNKSLSVNVVADSINPAESQTSQSSSPASTTGDEENNNANHGSDASDSGSVDSTEPTENTEPSASTGTSESSVSRTEPEDNPYASVPNVVWDADKGCYVYIVNRGDTLSQISGVVHVSVDRLVELNSIRNRDLIFTDESIVLP